MPPCNEMEITGREFEPVAEHAGLAYLRYSFTKGTAQEARFLLEVLELRPGMRVLDVGCGPGRHCRAFADAGVSMVGLDLSQAFLSAAGAGVWVRADARRLPFRRASFDAAVSLCQGGFGLLGGGDDGLVLAEMSRLVKRGGRIAASAFSAYFAVRHLEEGEQFDAGSGVNHERAEVRNERGEPAEFDLWTTCFTPRELRLMAAAGGISVRDIWSVAPGDYARRPPGLSHPEFLLIGDV